MKQYDVIVVGGGHAGTEAAWIAASMGSSVALVTLKISGIGVMSCNPAIGGLGKGHLVREIDALGGLMGRAADAAGIQFRLLNRTKGPAVQGPRAQSDRLLYQRFVGNALAGLPNLDIIEGEAIDLLIDGHAVAGVILADSSEIRAKSVILTTGTFLRGVIHIGDQSHAGGRVGDAASVAMAQRLDDMDLPLGRLKTGTPPRLNGKTIDWSVIEMQPGDDEPSFFSFMTRGVEARQIACGITHTNSKTHDIIRDNLAKSAMYGGHIDGVGPRYCPSIEDKIVRFADKESHQIFLEPEGLTTDTIYPNGISTSLPVAVQVDYVRSIRGLEQVEIEQPGYAIEYDYVDPRALRSSLELKSCPGLFLAGQINGTTGYEEAAAQGAVAAINAVRSAQGAETVLFSRKDSYIGVMVDDLVTRGVAEPYRMFTSRAEFRLMLRADNADQRLTPLGRELGIVTDERWRKFSDKAAAIEETTRRLGGMVFPARDISSRGAKLNVDGPARSGLDALALADFGWSDLVALAPSCADVAQEIGTQVKNDALYAHYIRRQEKDVEALAKDEALVIPADLCFDGIAGLSTELKVKLSKMRPENIAQARRIDGMTPAALLIIIGQIRQFPVKKAAR